MLWTGVRVPTLVGHFFSKQNCPTKRYSNTANQRPMFCRNRRSGTHAKSLRRFRDLPAEQISLHLTMATPSTCPHSHDELGCDEYNSHLPKNDDVTLCRDPNSCAKLAVLGNPPRRSI